MHEAGIIDRILDIVVAQAAEAKAVRVTSVHLEAGVLARVSEDALRFHWEQHAAGTPAEDAELLVTETEELSDLRLVSIDVEGAAGEELPSLTTVAKSRRESRVMRALVKSTPGPGLELRDMPTPEPGINDVLIKVRVAGICGTDLHIESWDPWAQEHIEPPLVVGHEFVGQIVEVGTNVVDFGPGEIVSGEGHVVCGRCRHCLAGRRHLCAHAIGLGVERDGAFAEYIVLPVTNVWHQWDGIPEDVAAIFDPFGNAVHTALEFPVLGEDVLVSGAGPIGLMAIAVVRHAGARYIVVSEPNAYRRRLAERMGATLVVDPASGALAAAQRELGMVEGFDVVLEMSGVPAAIREALAHMAHGGKLAQLGIPTEEIALDFNEIVFKMLTVSGIYGREMYETWYKMSVMVQSGLDISPAITHRFAFTDHEAAFEVARSGDSGKVLLDWSLR